MPNWMRRKLSAAASALATALAPAPVAYCGTPRAVGRFVGDDAITSPDSAYSTDSDDDDDDEILLWEPTRKSKTKLDEKPPTDYRWMLAAVENELSQGTRAVVYPEEYLARSNAGGPARPPQGGDLGTMVPKGYILDDVQL
ncbi:hypothetical protein ACHHYP_02683 [Achlya hypogyna]|uniref:Secreted protein n=1 Tax=Achlya hypogyna TaxID=1202772 RepID=A0A1V9ZS03_ACHHY|nr:hypothetical protein ACHHYP_02683 [Achlya hypogyna]